MSGEGVPDEDGRTRWQPSDPTPAMTVIQPASGGRSDGEPAPLAGAETVRAGTIREGDLLNHIFAVKRLVARGGMGEVYEGSNVNSDERVAIKVILPALAADPDVLAMFRKEARTLTRLQHEALVQYRVLAQEPQLGVLYIVTEYIDGANLADVLATLAPSPAELIAFLKRLASGLRAAHALGAIHRDISADNVLLAGGRLSGAKIIDFGIAKDLDPSSGTIVGDGFAGKLGYVAPEQLGDFGREVGPWTDVYSLGLLMLALAGGRDPGMGGTLVDAVDKRRAGPDLSAAPDALRPVLAAMLRPDPQDRLRSMDAVLDAIERQGASPVVGVDVPSAAPKTPRGRLKLPSFRLPPRRTLAGVAAGVVSLAGLAAWLGSGGEPVPPGRTVASRPTAASGSATPIATATAADPIAGARGAIARVLPAIGCSWLDIVDVTRRPGGLSVRMSGVAGSPVAAQNAVSGALAGAGLGGSDLDFTPVAPIQPAGCAALDAYRQVRQDRGGQLSVPRSTFEVEPHEVEGAVRKESKAVIDIAVANPREDFFLAGIEPSGTVTPLIRNRAHMQAEAANSPRGEPVADLGGGRYRVLSYQEHIGWSGLLLLTGAAPFDPALIAPPPAARGADWRRRFTDTARAKGWRAEMVWFKSVDERAD